MRTMLSKRTVDMVTCWSDHLVAGWLCIVLLPVHVYFLTSCVCSTEEGGKGRPGCIGNLMHLQCCTIL